MALGVLAVAAVVGYGVASATLWDDSGGGGGGGGPEAPTVPTNLPIDEVQRLTDTCEAGVMADCDALWDGTPTLSSGDGTAESCGGIDRDEPHRGTCVEDFGTNPTTTYP